MRTAMDAVACGITSRRPRSDHSLPMPLACTTWPGMSGNGSRTVITRITRARQRMGCLGLDETAVAGSSAAVHGATGLRLSGPPPAAEAQALAETAAWDSGLHGHSVPESSSRIL